MKPCSRERDCSNPDTDAQGRNAVPRFSPTAFCVADTALIREALREIPTLYHDLNCLLPRGSNASTGTPVSGTRERQLPLRLDILTLQEDLEAELRDHAARLRGFILPPRRVAIAVQQDSSYLRARLSALLALDGAVTGAEAGLYLLAWQHTARRLQGQHSQAERQESPCPLCDIKALIRVYGSDTITCSACGKKMSRVQYDQWAYLLSCDSIAAIGRKRNK